MGKKITLSITAKGTKTIKYLLGLHEADGDPDGYTAFYYARSKFTGEPVLWHYMYYYVIKHSKFDEFGETFNEGLAGKLVAHGVSLDIGKRKIIKRGDTLPTLNEAGTYFESMDIPLTAINSAGYIQTWAQLAITGEKPKITEKKVTISNAVKKGDVFTFKLLANKTPAEKVTEEGGTINIRSYTASDEDAQILSDWGLELVNYDSMDILVSDEVSFAYGTRIPAYGSVPTEIRAGTVKTMSETVYSGDQAIGTRDYYVADGTETAAQYRYTVLASGDKWVRSKDLQYINYGLIQVIDQAKLAKAITDAAAADSKGKALKKLQKGSKVNIMLDNLGTPGKGKITVSLASSITNGGDPANYNGALPANNKSNSEAARRTGSAAGYIPNNSTLTDETEEPESEETESVTIGVPRTIADLSASQKTFLAEKGYTVIAVLPEITANIDGQEDFAVELDEDSPEGAKLVYIPFPKNAEESDDDRIADFYDSEGSAIDEVPAQKSITVSPWLREGVTYAPVIAAENAE